MAARGATDTSASEETWHPARLIPVAGIKGQEEQERRATSALLAVMGAVRDFAYGLLWPLGAPRGRIGAFELSAQQVGRYLDIARDHGFDCLITISNQITSSHD